MKTNIITKPLSTFVMIVGILFIDTTGSQAVEIRGADDNPDILMRWHRVFFTFDGPSTSETANPNPSKIKVDIPCGMFRFIDIELKESLLISTHRGGDNLSPK